MDKLNNVLKANDIFNIHIFGLNIPISDSIIVMWIISVFLIIFAFVITRNLKTIPEGKQNFAEVLVEFINNFIKDNIGHHWRSFAPYLGTIFLFLIVANIISIFSIIPTGEELYKITGLEFFEHWPEFAIQPPTKDINVTATMGLMTVLLVLGSSIRFKNVFGWLKGLAKPSPIMIPFNILDYGTRFLSLSLRLFGNILAAFIVMELIYGLISPVVPAFLSLYFDLFDGILQAYIFVFLSSVYIAEAVE
ncbi:MAG: F0F1 ATP synthase subunit A [Clostridiales bacterium]|jgi:F-type H+-transporting ATPase subunit a|nr:F0F1 ATP synthase subunit A [Eubacteriales bacterium]MDH7566312.1 F0F1 ATP synthase subunit A [Clostridiales bacterium]